MQRLKTTLRNSPPFWLGLLSQKKSDSSPHRSCFSQKATSSHLTVGFVLLTPMLLPSFNSTAAIFVSTALNLCLDLADLIFYGCHIFCQRSVRVRRALCLGVTLLNILVAIANESSNVVVVDDVVVLFGQTNGGCGWK
jgi:hypothetical protein